MSTSVSSIALFFCVPQAHKARQDTINAIFRIFISTSRLVYSSAKIRISESFPLIFRRKNAESQKKAVPLQATTTEIMKKRIAKWATGILLTPVILFFIAAALLYVPPVQDFAVGKATVILSESTGMDVSVKRLRLTFLFDLDLQEVRVDDGEGQNLLDVEHLNVDLNFSSLLRGRIDVEGIELTRAAVDTKALIPGVAIKGSIGSFFVDSHGIELPQETVTVNPSLCSVDGIRTSPPPWAEFVMMPLDMDTSLMASFSSWLAVAATTMSEPSMYVPAVSGSTATRTTSSAIPSSSGRTSGDTTLILKPSKCLHLRRATFPPPNTVTRRSPGDRTIGDIRTFSKTLTPPYGDPDGEGCDKLLVYASNRLKVCHREKGRTSGRTAPDRNDDVRPCPAPAPGRR